MYTLKIPISDLITINDKAKVLKKTNVMVTGNSVVSYNDIHNWLCFTPLPDSYTIPHIDGLVFSKTELTRYLKNATVDSIEIDLDRQVNTVYPYTDSETPMSIYIDKPTSTYINDSILWANKDWGPSDDITSQIGELFDLGAKDGSMHFKYNYHGKELYMTLFYGVLPLSKSDRILLNINIGDNNVFYTRFTVLKPKDIKVTCLLTYLNPY